MNGILVCDKPEGFTSFDVIAKLRGILKEKKIGHGGTLDPMATGVLPLFVGGATKCADLLPCTQKRYTATVRVGQQTDTGDITGSVIAQSEAFFSRDALEAALKGFVGEQQQIPPMYSALKVDGQRLYDLARQGKTVERKARSITVESIELLDFSDSSREFVLNVRCSKGTYIRSLAQDIAGSLGALACLSALRRTMSAGFCEQQAFTLPQIQSAVNEGRNDFLLETHTAFREWTAAELDDNLTRLFLNGFNFDASRLPVPLAERQSARLFSRGSCIGIGTVSEGKLRKLCAFV